MDGVCIGHPRCQVYHCTERLQSPRDRFCESHRALDSVCVIHGCTRDCTDGKRTCDTPSHRKVEEDRRRKGRAMFELKRRLEARDVASSIRAVPSVELSPSVELDDPDLDDPPTTSNVDRKPSNARKPKIKSTLTRRWTHNEQLLVRPCGVIISRATFYQAESLPNCRVRPGYSTMHPPLSQFILALPERDIPRTLPRGSSIIPLLRQQLQVVVAHCQRQRRSPTQNGLPSGRVSRGQEAPGNRQVLPRPL